MLAGFSIISLGLLGCFAHSARAKCLLDNIGIEKVMTSVTEGVIRVEGGLRLRRDVDPREETVDWSESDQDKSTSSDEVTSRSSTEEDDGFVWSREVGDVMVKH